MTPTEIRRLATTVYDRLAVLHQARFPGPGRTTEETLAAMMAAETGIDVDTMKVVIRPESRLAPWSSYESVLTALDADPDTTSWFAEIHHELAKTLPAWRPPPRDIADITTPAEFMALVRRMRQLPHPISVSALSREMCSRDSKSTWRRTQLGNILDADTLPPKGKPTSVRNLLETLCENARRPATDVDHFLETWRRLQPHTATAPPGAFAARQPAPDHVLREKLEHSAKAVKPWKPATKTLIALGLIVAVVLVLLAAML
jgi:hypothetical protein